MTRVQRRDLPSASEPQRSLSDRLYEEIYQRISSNEWAEGARLPTETDLANQFGVSRSVVREALVRLRVDGLITSKQGAGSHVTGHPSRIVLEHARPCSIADIQRCYEFRVGVEGEAAFLAAQRRALGKIAKIEESLVALERCMKAQGEGADEDLQFHLAVARATENDYFVTTVNSLSQSIRIGISIANSLSTLPTGGRLKFAYADHCRVFEAIRAGNPDEARAVMRTHIENSRKRVFVGL